VNALVPSAEIANVEIDFVVDCWAARAVARAYLWANGEIGLHDAVDRLQADAERDGLIAIFGQGEIQAALALAFGTVRC
jgi:hypothetical protein